MDGGEPPRGGGGGGAGGRPYSTEDIARVAFFLRYAERDGATYGGHTATEAFEAACRIMQLPPDEFRRVIDG